MGRDTLKHVLSQQVQMLERDFASLVRSSPTWNELQTRSLEIISVTLRRLAITIASLPDPESLSIDMRNELRNQITVVMGYAQLMMHRRAGELSLESTTYLQKMMTIVMQINSSLDRDKKKKARNG